jgi:hypothetical protein
MTLRGEDPNKYVNDPVLYENVVVQFEANGLSREQVHEVLQKQGFNLPQNLVETPVLGESTDPLADAPPDLRLVAGAVTKKISDAPYGSPPLELKNPLPEPSAPAPTAVTEPQVSVTKEIPMQAHLARDPNATLRLKNPLGDPEFIADIEGSLSEIPGPAEPEGREAEDAVVETIPATATDSVQEADLRITPEEVETYSSQVQEMVAAYMEESPFYSDTAELPFKADIDAVDLQIKSLNDRLEQIGEEKIKPYFGKDDTGRKILAAIAAGVGAYASAMSGTPNYALGIINKAIDDDLDKQKLEIGFRRKGLEDQRILLTTKRMELLKMTEMKLNKAWRQAQDSRAKQKIKAMLTEVVLSNDTENKKLARARADKLLKQTLDLREGLVPNMGENPGESGMTSLTGLGRNLIVKKAITFNILYGEAKDHVDELLKLVTKDKLKVMTPEIFSSVRSMFGQRITALKLLAAKKLYEFGAALTKNEEKLLDDIIADYKSWKVASDITTTRLTNFLEIMESQRKSIRDAGGFISVGKKGGAQGSTSNGGLPALSTLEPGTAKK